MALVATIVGLIESLISLYILVIVIAVIMSWLIAFNVINLHNNFVRSVVRTLDALTQPIFGQVRKIIPPLGGMDFSPLIVWILLSALNFFLKMQFGNFEFF